LTVHAHIDSTCIGRITGWAFAAEPAHAAPLVIEAWSADQCLGRTVANRPRPDVAAAFPAFDHSKLSGFDLEFRMPDAPADLAEIRFQVSSPKGEPHVIGTAQQWSRRGFDKAVAPTSDDTHTSPAPFPADIVAAVSRLWPESDTEFSSDEAQDAMAERIIALSRGPESTQIAGLMRYLRYLRAVWAHFQFVARYFPNINARVAIDSKDSYGKQNTPEEMLAIANHLYVLKSRGLAGDFAEFGCFKGYSSSMLSHACEMLGIRMHIFDSFEGLPPSDSSYYAAGDFRGDLEEVQHNVATFGAPGAVSYHKGFFSDSLPRANIPQLMSLWMDVDLASSAKDLMIVADQIDPRGAVFSHECDAGNFVDGAITAHPDSVIPAIVDRFAQLGTPVTGRFLSGNTGAFWRGDSGIPVLSSSALLRLITSI